MADPADVVAAHRELSEASDAVQRLLVVEDLIQQQIEDARDRLARADQRVKHVGPLEPGPGPGSPKFTISPKVANFGVLAVGQTSTPITFTVKNVGGAPSGTLNVFAEPFWEGPFGPYAEFSVLDDTCTGKTLGVLQTCSFAVTFHPTLEAAEHNIHPFIATGVWVENATGKQGTPTFGTNAWVYGVGRIAIPLPHG
jgi:hypothetical protein